MTVQSADQVVSGSGWSGLFWHSFRQSKNPMVLLDEQRRHVEVNGAYLQLLGYRRDELIGQPAYRFMAEGPLATAGEWQNLLRRRQFTGTAELVCADGGRVRVEFAGHPEVVTGRHLVLFVALRVVRANRRLLAGAEPQPAESTLSRRQIEIVRLIALGMTGREIAAELNIAHDTVRAHARNSMVRTGARTRAQLVAKCLGEGLLGDL